MESGGGTETRDGGCFLYYAYGSNLLRERLLLSSPSAALCAVARLQVRAGEPGAAVPRVGGGSPWESACPGGVVCGPGSAAPTPLACPSYRWRGGRGTVRAGGGPRHPWCRGVGTVGACCLGRPLPKKTPNKL